MPKKAFILTLCIISYLVCGRPAAARSLAPGVRERVEEYATNQNDTLLDVVIFMDNPRLDVTRRAAASRSMTRDARIKSVLTTLIRFQSMDANRVAAYLERNSPEPVSRLWIVPAFSARVRLSQIETIVCMPGVKLIVENAALSFDPPVEISAAPALSGGISDELALLGVSELWRRGLTGHGRLVCSFDTGVDRDHPALSAKWRGNQATLSSAWFSKVTPDEPPTDKTGHGTHTMGLMVGAAEADSFGVAPDAQWITAGVIDQGRSLPTTLTDIMEAFQWVLNPDGDTGTTYDVPDVILNSWGIPRGLFEPCDATFAGLIEAVEAAGIVTIFAAGNEGPEAMSLRNPADLATTPVNCFSVGAVDGGLTVANFSSRGPSSCDPSRIKPEVVAPGVAVRSSQKGGGYAYMSGTSMAAPFVAGLVALMRQYNPDATVDQIKYALLQATTDLGATGEDNAYGRGLVDASRLLGFLPVPTEPDINISHKLVSDDGIAWPGEGFGLQLVLTNIGGNIESVLGKLISPHEDKVVILDDEAIFFFGIGGTSARNFIPFRLFSDSTLYHGQEIPFTLELSRPDGEVLDSIAFGITAGIMPGGRIGSHNTSRIGFSVSDFGQYGFGPGSAFNAGGEGFTYHGSPNLLYEAGLILARNPLQLSSSIRDSSGGFRPSDFVPLDTLSGLHVTEDGGIGRTASFSDRNSQIPIPITVVQKTRTYDIDDGLLIAVYYIKNATIEKLTDLHFGFMADFDLMGDWEQVTLDEQASLVYQESDQGPLVGLVALRNVATFRSIDGGTTKTGFSRSEQFDLVSVRTGQFESVSSSDRLFIINSGPFIIDPLDSVEVAFALVAGDDLATLYDNADRARERFDFATSVIQDNSALMPTGAVLHQNYPNPFNPTTTISFHLCRSDFVSLAVYNTLGQKVRDLPGGRLAAGSHTVRWDATDNAGNRVSSGVYFYRLSSGGVSHSRKMVLLK
ncbi:MAG: S8 family serine peptidase [candidate division Zixibacteria bacterium]|nr:S8 family serine peptidase [candidate division Zixibacteria bacterium]